MNTIKKMFVKVVRGVRELTLVGAIVGASSLLAGATETVEKAAPAAERLETVELTTVTHNLEAIVAALTVIDPTWAESLPKSKTQKAAKKAVSSEMEATAKQIAKKIEEIVCFTYRTTAPDSPSESQATDPDNYSNAPLDCDVPETLCGICFDALQFPLGGNNMPDFDANPDLKDLIEENRLDDTKDGQKIFAPDNVRWVILHFRGFSD